MLNRIKIILEMIKFEHTIFALPFAFTGALLALSDLGLSEEEGRARAERARGPAGAPVHVEDQAVAPDRSHSSRNRSWAFRTRRARAPREQVFRYRVRRKTGNSARQADQSMLPGGAAQGKGLSLFRPIILCAGGSARLAKTGRLPSSLPPRQLPHHTRAAVRRRPAAAQHAYR